MTVFPHSAVTVLKSVVLAEVVLNVTVVVVPVPLAPDVPPQTGLPGGHDAPDGLGIAWKAKLPPSAR